MNAMKRICKELYRVSKSGASFVLSTASHQSYNANYYSYTRKASGLLTSGDLVECHINGNGNSFDIEDTYWTENDYAEALRDGGWLIKCSSYPVPGKKREWYLDEASKPPFLVIASEKPSAY
jgi:hypothetical protein